MWPLKETCAAVLALGLATAPTLAAPLPVVPFDQANVVELTAAEKGNSKVETTKAWLKTKKTQTTRWMGRQKQKIKRLVD